MKPKKQLLTMCSVLLIAALLAACGSPAAAPTATPVPPTPASIPPMATPLPDTPASAPPSQAGAGKVTIESGEITSQALAGNLLGDPTARKFYVVLPPSYETSEKRYPVVYVLPWGPGYPRDNAYAFKIVLEDLLKDNRSREMIVVAPDGTNKLGASLFRSSPTIGDYETYITQELVGYIDSHYRTIPSRENRGLAGCSNGGDATMRLSLKYPNVFGAASASGGLYDDKTLEQNALLLDELTTLKELPTDPDGVRRLATTYPIAAGYIQVAASAAPNQSKPPLYLDMPFRIIEGKAEIVQEIAARITEYDSAREAQRYVQQPIRLRGILIQHALKDRYNPTDIVRGFDRLLTELEIEHEYMEIDAYHCAHPWEAMTLKFMSDNLVGEE